MKRRQEGFTLVELLVVIAIIIILAAILFPVFAKARDKAQQSKCLNNLKQMGTACSMYEDDYDGMVMPFSVYALAYSSSGVPLISGYEYWGYMWCDLIDPYLKQLKGTGGLEIKQQGEIYVCPSAPIEEATVAYKAAKTYGYNAYLRNSTTGEMVKYPSLTMRLTETSTQNPDLPPGPSNAYEGGSWYAPYPSSPGYMRYAPGWHSGQNCMLWMDHHVTSMHYSRVMWNDGLPDPNSPDWVTGNVWARLTPKPGAAE